MIRSTNIARGVGTLLLLGLGVSAGQSRTPEEVAMASLAPATMVRVGTVDERYQSYNVEMLEVTGGKILEALWAGARRDPHTTGIDRRADC